MKCGFAAIIGRPSAGKSTLLNALCGEKVAITSPVPQTTRNAIKGMVNSPSGQIIFLDTPGYHQSDKKFNIYLKDIVHGVLDAADVILYVIDAARTPGREEKAIIELLGKSRVPVVVALNKVDTAPPRIPEIRGLILIHLHPAAMIDVSALKAVNLTALTDAVLEACPEGEPHYPADVYTDQSPEFRISEIIREQAIVHSRQELPHALYVEIADMEFTPAGLAGSPDMALSPGTLWVRAFITVERPTQVGILVGREGARIKEIRIAALSEMKRIFPWKIRLDLRVKTHPKWRKKDPLLKRLTGAAKVPSGQHEISPPPNPKEFSCM